MRPGTVICLLAGGEAGGGWGADRLWGPLPSGIKLLFFITAGGASRGVTEGGTSPFPHLFSISTAPTVLTASQSSLHEDSAQSDARLLPKAAPPIGRVICQFTAIAKQATNNKNSILQMRSKKKRKRKIPHLIILVGTRKSVTELQGSPRRKNSNIQRNCAAMEVIS